MICLGCRRESDTTHTTCTRCNQPAHIEHDTRGRIQRIYNRRGQLVHLAAAANTIELWGDQPRVANPNRGALAALDNLPKHIGPFGALQ